jgi:hypothetical protein
MKELRVEIRAAFEKEQAKHPPLPSLRQTVVEAARVQLRETKRQWLAVAAAILIGILVVTGLVTSGLNRATVPSHVPPVGEYGQPQTGLPLIYVADPNHQDWYIGFDWSGKPRATVKLAKPLDRLQNLYQAPDGSGFRITDRRTLSAGDYFPERLGSLTGDYVDRLGNTVPGTLPAAGARGIWADDSLHLCLEFVDPQTGDWTLATKLPGEPAKTVMAIPHGQAAFAESATRVASCSFKSDRAILVHTLFAQPLELWLVRISDGKVLDDHVYPMEQFDSMVASSDGAYIAENGRTLNGVRVKPTQIRRVSDWTVVASWTGRADVVGFTGNGSLVVFSNWGESSGVDVMDWRSQSVLWRSTTHQPLVGLLAQPNGRAIAVAFAPLDYLCAAPVDMCPTVFGITIVHGDGTATQLPGRGTAW